MFSFEFSNRMILNLNFSYSVFFRSQNPNSRCWIIQPVSCFFLSQLLSFSTCFCSLHFDFFYQGTHLHNEVHIYTSILNGKLLSCKIIILFCWKFSGSSNIFFTWFCDRLLFVLSVFVIYVFGGIISVLGGTIQCLLTDFVGLALILVMTLTDFSLS